MTATIQNSVFHQINGKSFFHNAAKGMAFLCGPQSRWVKAATIQDALQHPEWPAVDANCFAHHATQAEAA